MEGKRKGGEVNSDAVADLEGAMFPPTQTQDRLKKSCDRLTEGLAGIVTQCFDIGNH